MIILIRELRKFIRQREKYTELSVSDARLLEEMRDKFYRILDENNILNLLE